MKIIKKLIAITFCICIWGISFNLHAQNSTHLEFKGVSLNGNLPSFVQKMESKGFSVVRNGDDIVSMEGSFAGKEVTIYIVGSSKTKTVWKVRVVLPKSHSWSSIKSDYKYMKDMYTTKYGVPSDSYEFFSSPYYEGDGYEMQALRNDKCTYFCAFETSGGVIWIEMDEGEYIAINYEDKQNTTKHQSEKDSSVIDDI